MTRESRPEEAGCDHTVAEQAAIDFAKVWLATEPRRSVPVCFHCARVRSDQGLWREVPARVFDLLGERPDLALLTHGICPDCYTVYYTTEHKGADG